MTFHDSINYYTIARYFNFFLEDGGTNRQVRPSFLVKVGKVRKNYNKVNYTFLKKKLKNSIVKLNKTRAQCTKSYTR